jgi:hypothetical protein
MSKPFRLHLAGFALALVLGSTLTAQTRSAVSNTDFDAAIATRQPDSKERIQRFLGQADTRAAAARLGISPSALSARIAQLDSTSLNAVARQINQAEEQLAGGDRRILGIGIGVAIIILLIILL